MRRSSCCTILICIILFLVSVFFTIFCTFVYPKKILESMTSNENVISNAQNMDCPPIGQEHTIECPNIEDPFLKRNACMALYTNCKERKKNIKKDLKPLKLDNVFENI